jgi:four helix bundle protein
MSIEGLKDRFQNFATQVARLTKRLPENSINYAYCNQLVRSSSSSAANYRAACRAKSTPDFINKLKITEEELDESIYFLEMLRDFNKGLDEELAVAASEANQLLSIVVASIKTARRNFEANKKR